MKCYRMFFITALVLFFVGTPILLSAAEQMVIQKPVQKSTIGIQKMIQKMIRVVYPNGGETLIRGKTYTIRWQSTGIQNVQINLIDANVNRTYVVGSATAAAGSYQWKISKRQDNAIPPASYRVNIKDLAGTLADSSDSRFQIVLPAVDLECFNLGLGGISRPDKNHRSIKVRIRNNGNRVLNDVLFDWLIKKKQIMVSQDGAGFSKVFPGTFYDIDVIKVSKKSEEDWRDYVIEFYLDPQNRQGEDEDLRVDNKCIFSDLR